VDGDNDYRLVRMIGAWWWYGNAAEVKIHEIKF
jgi:hypothetical protein